MIDPVRRKQRPDLGVILRMLAKEEPYRNPNLQLRMPDLNADFGPDIPYGKQPERTNLFPAMPIPTSPRLHDLPGFRELPYPGVQIPTGPVMGPIDRRPKGWDWNWFFKNIREI